MPFIKLADVNLVTKRVLIRADLNVPVAGGRVMSDARIAASVPTIQHCMAAGARVQVMSHRGRPREGDAIGADNTMRPVADDLSRKLGRAVRLVDDYLSRAPAVAAGECVLFENVRLNRGEKADDDKLARGYAALCDVFVMDAFGTAHRAQSSTCGVGRYAPAACAGLLLEAELAGLGRALANPARPMVAVVGGAKVSTKLTVLESLADKVDRLIVGGGIANTFLKAAGCPVGRSLSEDGLVATAAGLIEKMRGRGADIPIATDVITAKAMAADAKAELKTAAAVGSDDMIFDIGPDTAARFGGMIAEAGTIIWNGPVGVFEYEHFAAGTRAVAMAVADAAADSLAGGGETVAAIEKFGVADKVSYISTAGGAFLEYLEGKTLPAVAMLEQRAAAV